MNYQRKDYFELFEEQLGEFHLMQLVKVDTWSRLVGSELRSSLLDHIYVNSVNLVKNPNWPLPQHGRKLNTYSKTTIFSSDYHSKTKYVKTRFWMNPDFGRLFFKLEKSLPLHNIKLLATRNQKTEVRNITNVLLDLD